MPENASTLTMRLPLRHPLGLAVVITVIALFTGCWVQSVYPFYKDSDVIVDTSLVGTWAGEAELKNCLLNISLDPDTRDYKIEVSNQPASSANSAADAQCESTKLAGKLVQLGRLRFLEITLDPEKFWPAALDTVLKLDANQQWLTLTPLDAEWMSNALSNGGVKLQGRIQESGGLLPMVAVTLVSPTSDLRDFLLQADTEGAFSRTDQMRFLRR